MRRHNGQPPNAACLFPPRRTEGLSNRIPFSFVSPALVVLRLLFSVCSPSPQKARALACPSGKIACPHAGKNHGAPESVERRDAFLTFAERTHSCLSQKEGARRAAHEREFGGRRLRRRFAAWSHPLGIREHETRRHQQLPPRQRQRQRHTAWSPSGLRRQALSTGNRFAAGLPPQDSASPQVLVNGVGTAPRHGRRSGGDLCPMSAPRPEVLRRPSLCSAALHRRQSADALLLRPV